MIPFNNFRSEYRFLKPDLDKVFRKLFLRGHYILGDEVTSFEAEFGQFLGVRYCVGVGSGTDAITLSLLALGIGTGDEVLTTAMTAFPTVVGIQRAGATAVLVDISLHDGLIDIAQIENKITKRTKAIVPVHLYGQSCNIRKILALAKKYHLKVIEDCAQSTGATFAGHPTGSFGHCAAFSFYPTKNLGAYGDGGAVLTNDERVFERLKSLRNYGQRLRYHFDANGVNSRLDEMQAAILRVKLKYLKHWNKKRFKIAQLYRSQLRSLTLPTEHSYGVPVYHLFVVRAFERDRLQNYLRRHRIETQIHYPYLLHKQKAFSGARKDTCPNAKVWSSQVLSLPLNPFLSNQDVERVCERINNFTGS